MPVWHGHRRRSPLPWVLLALGFLATSWAFPSRQSRVSESAFPYEFWKPTSSLDLMVSPTSTTKQPAKERVRKYGYYYGQKRRVKDQKVPSKILPIKVPKDIIGDVSERTTINPLKDITTHPSSLIPQYGRNPGGTEKPPLYFPHGFPSSKGHPLNQNIRNRIHPIPKPNQKHLKSNFLNEKLAKNRNSKPPSSLHYNTVYNQRGEVKHRPPKLIKIVNIDRNDEPPPHAFYAIHDSPELEVSVLHNDTYMTYLYPNRLKEKTVNNVTRKIGYNYFPYRSHSPSRPKYDIFDFSRYKVQSDFNHPHATRKNYNENIVELIRNKIESKTKFPGRIMPSPNHSDRNTFYQSSSLNKYGARPVGPQIDRPILRNDYLAPPTNYIPRRRNSTKNYMTYPTSKFPSTHYSTRYQPKYTKPPPNMIYPTQTHSPLKYVEDNSITSRIKKFFANAFKRPIKLAPNSYPEEKHHSHQQPNHYLYYYHSAEMEDSYDPPKKSIMERLASLQSSPVTLAIPGGLAAVGLGLAFYYFNYVWYPTPVVTARLLQILNMFTGEENLNEKQTDEIGKILEAFRGLEGQEVTTEVTSDSCRDRLVCQVHQDIPGLWKVTQVITPIIGSQLESATYEKLLETYLEIAKEGTQHEKSCEIIYRDCSLPYVSLKPLLSLLTEHQEEDLQSEYGESRVL